MHRKKISIIVGSILAFILISYGAFIAYFSINPILIWKTFATEDFSLRYPSNWEIRITSDNRDRWEAQKGEVYEQLLEFLSPEGEFLTIKTWNNPQKLSILDFLKNTNLKYRDYPDDSKMPKAPNFTLAGTQGLRIYKEGSSQFFPRIEIYLPKREKLFEINCSLRKAKLSEDICLKVLSTFSPKD